MFYGMAGNIISRDSCLLEMHRKWWMTLFMNPYMRN